jgi:hypothetical protein
VSNPTLSDPTIGKWLAPYSLGTDRELLANEIAERKRKQAAPRP